MNPKEVIFSKVSFNEKKVLDFRCNIKTEIFKKCKEYKAKYFGFDINDSAKKWLKKNKIFIDFWKTKQKFDIIISTQVYEHLTKKEQEKFIKRSYKLLNKKGILIIEYPNINNIKGVGFWASDRTHRFPPSLFDESTLIDLFGFDSEIYATGFSIWGPRNILIEIINILLDFIPQHNILIIAKKN